MAANVTKYALTVGPQAYASDPEALISQPELQRLAGGVSAMTIWRWRKKGILPPPLVIERRNYWRRQVALAALHAAGGQAEAPGTA